MRALGRVVTSQNRDDADPAYRTTCPAYHPISYFVPYSFPPYRSAKNAVSFTLEMVQNGTILQKYCILWRRSVLCTAFPLIGQNGTARGTLRFGSAHHFECIGLLFLLGATGQVLMNNKAVRVPSYATYYVYNGTPTENRRVEGYPFSGTMRIVVELTARLGDKLKCAMSEHDCSEHVGFP